MLKKTGFNKYNMCCLQAFIACVAFSFFQTIVFGQSSLREDEDIVFVDRINHAFIKVANSVRPSVVSIKIKKMIKYRRNTPLNRFFYPRDKDDERLFEREQTGIGSGVVISVNGLIVTNNHVIDGAEEITVRFTDKRVMNASVIGTDEDTDVALIKVEGDNYLYASLGDSDELEVGQWVLTIGTPFNEQLSSTVTAGIISALGRKNLLSGSEYKIENFIQTDAAINPGNSGGPLINLYGEVIGINSAILSQNGSSEGYGFAIAINLVKSIIDDIKKHGSVLRGFIGVHIKDIEDQEEMHKLKLDSPHGIIIDNFSNNSAGKTAGLKKGDVIIEVDGKKIKQVNELQTTIARKDPGDIVQLTVMRNGEKKLFSVELRDREDAREISTQFFTPKSDPLMFGLEVETYSETINHTFSFNHKEGIIIKKIEPDYETFYKGLNEGDLIWQIGNHSVRTVMDFEDIVNSLDEKVLFYIEKQDGSTMLVSLSVKSD